MKKITALILCFALIWNFEILYADAADNQSFLGGTYQEEEGKIHLLCVIPEETASKENFEVILGDVPVSVDSVVTVSETEVPRMVYCLVDVSGSMKGRMEQAKEVLRTVSGGLEEKDCLVIGKMGNQITDSGVLTGGEAEKEIDSLQYTGEDTDLYSGLVHGLRFLLQQPKTGVISALIVISDGCDDQGDGSTWKEAYEAVGKADIPVYTVAPILSPSDYEQAKELGSFARNSAGGLHFPKSEDNSSSPASMTGEEIGMEILGHMANVFDVEIDVSNIKEVPKDKYVVSVAFTNYEGKVYKDSMEIMAKDILLAEENKEEPETETETRESEPESVPEPEPESKPSNMVAAAAGIMLLLAAGILAVSMKQKKKKEKEEQERKLRQMEEEKRQKERERLEQERLEQERKRQEEALARQKAYEEALKREQEAAYNALPRLSLRLSSVGVKNKNHVIQLVKGVEMTVGRNSKSQIILDSQDTKLSGAHFAMFWDGKSVYVWDMQSKNGTSVNGVVINHLGRVAIKPGDSLRVGNYEYRLYWED